MATQIIFLVYYEGKLELMIILKFSAVRTGTIRHKIRKKHIYDGSGWNTLNYLDSRLFSFLRENTILILSLTFPFFKRNDCNSFS